jgi:hypothetical protein
MATIKEESTPLHDKQNSLKGHGPHHRSLFTHVSSSDGSHPIHITRDGFLMSSFIQRLIFLHFALPCLEDKSHTCP